MNSMNAPFAFAAPMVPDRFNRPTFRRKPEIATTLSDAPTERDRAPQSTPSPVEVSSASTANPPNDLAWEAFADWRPACFGRLALEYATRFGLYVLPLLVEGSAPVYGAVPHGSADASRDPATIQAWWTRAPRANVGIACGLSGLLVLEVNPQGGGQETLAMQAQRLGPLPSTWMARTPGGWTQYFFAHVDPDVFSLLSLRPLGPGVQVVHRNIVLAPPSRIGGQRSAWHYGARPGQVPLAAMPASWMDRLTGRRLPPNGLSGLDARHSILGRVFERLGWLGRMLDDGRRIARCPWVHEHAWPGGAGGDTATVLFSPECAPWFGGFACQHPECIHREERDLLKVLPEEVLEAARLALPGVVRVPDFTWDDELAVERTPKVESALELVRDVLWEFGPDPAHVVGPAPDARSRVRQ